MYPKLFESIKIRGLEIKNRVVFPAMGSRYCDYDGYAGDQLAAYHAARAKGGCGLNIVEACAVYRPGFTKNMLQLTDDSYIEGLKKTTDAIHAEGGLACIQLWQGGIAASTTPNAQIVIPSDLPMGPHVIPGASKETIQTIVKNFGEAAKRAVEAGFDCIEYHAAHSYSPHFFLCPALNHRTDEYGGSAENRARYLLESIREIRKNIPENMPLLMRISAQDDYLPNGMTIDDIIEFCKWAKDAGVDALDISRGNLLTPAMKFEVPPLDIPRSFNVDNAAKIRKETGMVTIAVGRINDPDQAEEILASDKADMVVIGRAQLADAEFCNKAKDGKVEDLVRCVGCNQGCYDNTTMEVPITCLRNPMCGKEYDAKYAQKADVSKKVLVIGGGVGGMEAAITAEHLGHKVILVEASDHLGGQFLLAGKAPRKEEMAIATQDRARQLRKTSVEVRLNTFADTTLITEIQPDYVIVAIGSSPIIPPIEGVERAVSALDVLSGKVSLTGDCIVVGGGLVGLETAETLAVQGNKVTVIEMLEKIAKDVGAGRSITIPEGVRAAGIQTLTEAKCTRIGENSVTVETKDGSEELTAAHVVLAVGSKAKDSSGITDYCKENGIPVSVIGDAKEARRALQAIHEGFEAAYLV